MARYLLETSATDGYLLEDGSGVLLIDEVTVTAALAGTQAAPTSSIAAKETIKATAAGTSAAPSGAIAATLTISGTAAGAQPAPSGAITGRQVQDVTAEIVAWQAAPSGAITGTSGTVTPAVPASSYSVRRRAAAPSKRRPVRVAGYIAATQAPPSGLALGAVNDDDLAFIALEAA